MMEKHLAELDEDAAEPQHVEQAPRVLPVDAPPPLAQPGRHDALDEPVAPAHLLAEDADEPELHEVAREDDAEGVERADEADEEHRGSRIQLTSLGVRPSVTR